MHSQFSIFISDAAGGWHCAETSFCWFPGVYQRPQNSIPFYKNKILCFKRPFDGTKPYVPVCPGLSNCVLAKQFLCILPPPPPHPLRACATPECGSLGSLCQVNVYVCVKMQALAKTFCVSSTLGDSSFLREMQAADICRLL